MVRVGRPICTCLEQIRPAAVHGRPIPCWLFMIKICFGKPHNSEPEICRAFWHLYCLTIFTVNTSFLDKKNGIRDDSDGSKYQGEIQKGESPPTQMFPTRRRKTRSTNKCPRRGCTCCGIIIWPLVTSLLITCYAFWVINHLEASEGWPASPQSTRICASLFFTSAEWTATGEAVVLQQVELPYRTWNM